MARKFSAWIGAIALAAICSGCAQSDAGITTKVKAKLETDRNVTNASSIRVATNGNVVTLTGTAASDAEKTHVLQVAKSTEGVKDVVDQMTVSPTAPPSSDSGMAAPAPTAAPPAR